MKRPKKPVFNFLLGTAAGIALGLFLASDNKEELISDLLHKSKKVKGNLEEEIEKGKKFVDDLKNKMDDLLLNL